MLSIREKLEQTCRMSEACGRWAGLTKSGRTMMRAIYRQQRLDAIAVRLRRRLARELAQEFPH